MTSIVLPVKLEMYANLPLVRWVTLAGELPTTIVGGITLFVAISDDYTYLHRQLIQ